MTSLLMKPTSAGKDTLHEQDQLLKKLVCLSNLRGPLLKSNIWLRINLSFNLHLVITWRPYTQWGRNRDVN